MADRIVRTSHQSYGDRISGSCKNLCMAPVLLVIGICILAWNEGNLVTHRRALDEGLKKVVSVSEINTIDPTNEGKLIHFMGAATADNAVSDPLFGVSPTDALKLKRTVQMYQWVETSHTTTKKKSGGSTYSQTTYTYSKVWVGAPINSNAFFDSGSHENPTSGMLFSNETMVATPIYVGAFQLSNDITSKMNWYEPLQIPLSVDFISDEETRNGATVYASQFYFGSATNPQIGDTRVSFEQIPSQTISVVAKQVGSDLAPFLAASGGFVLLVEPGPHDAAEMFKHANDQLTAMTWAFRLCGFLFVYFAFSTCLQPLSAFADFIPFVGYLVEAGNDFLSLFLATNVSILVVAVAWFSYRPMFSLLLFGVSGGIGYAYWKNKKKSAPSDMDYEMLTVHSDPYSDDTGNSKVNTCV